MTTQRPILKEIKARNWLLLKLLFVSRPIKAAGSLPHFKNKLNLGALLGKKIEPGKSDGCGRRLFSSFLAHSRPCAFYCFERGLFIAACMTSIGCLFFNQLMKGAKGA